MSKKAEENRTSGDVEKQGQHDLQETKHRLRLSAEVSDRRQTLFKPAATQDDLVKTLYWMSEQGNQEDLEYLRLARKTKPFSSEFIDQLFEIVESQIRVRESEKKEDQLRVKKNLAQYIQKTLEELHKRERNYRIFGYFWYGLGLIVLATGFGVTLWRAQNSPGIPSPSDWPTFAQLALLMVIVIGLLWALAKYAFTLGKSFMVESLRNSDRIHAIRFGEFYLKAFPDEADWEEIKEAFQHWNIDMGSAFFDQDPAHLDHELTKVARDVVNVLKKSQS